MEVAKHMGDLHIHWVVAWSDLVDAVVWYIDCFCGDDWDRDAVVLGEEIGKLLVFSMDNLIDVKI